MLYYAQAVIMGPENRCLLWGSGFPFPTLIARLDSGQSVLVSQMNVQRLPDASYNLQWIVLSRESYPNNSEIQK